MVIHFLAACKPEIAFYYKTTAIMCQFQGQKLAVLGSLGFIMSSNYPLGHCSFNKISVPSLGEQLR